MFVLVDLEALHHLINDDVGVVEAQFFNGFVGFPELKMSLLEVVFQVIPCFVRQIGDLSRPDVIFEIRCFCRITRARFIV